MPARFERGLTKSGARRARATRIILDLSPVRLRRPPTFIPNHDAAPVALLRGDRAMLGVRYDPEQVLDVLSRLGFHRSSTAKETRQPFA
jgi:hypothetical protein